ncbi:hypothetical protein [Streptomyces calidiresistens]|nr:hypothetical protein [Streptomyces calidiresistens]
MTSPASPAPTAGPPGVSRAAEVLDPEATVRALAADRCAELVLS